MKAALFFVFLLCIRNVVCIRLPSLEGNKSPEFDDEEEKNTVSLKTDADAFALAAVQNEIFNLKERLEEEKRLRVSAQNQLMHIIEGSLIALNQSHLRSANEVEKLNQEFSSLQNEHLIFRKELEEEKSARIRVQDQANDVESRLNQSYTELERMNSTLQKFIASLIGNKGTAGTASGDDMISSTIKTSKDYSVCGVGLEHASDPSRRIDEGHKALEPWPWMAALFIAENAYDVPQLKCGGSIVGNQWILTAAHCLKNWRNEVRELQSVTVKLGLTHLRNESSLQEFEPMEFKIHEQFDREKLDYDIALIKLDRLIEYNVYVRPICLPPEELNEDTTLYEFKETAFVTGWGHDKKIELGRATRVKTVEHLKELRFPIQSNDRCLWSLENTTMVFTDRMFCAGSGLGEADVCSGDGGGPMMQSQINHEGNVYWVQVGIVSWGIGCGQINTYGFYTHVQRLRNWVVETMNSD